MTGCADVVQIEEVCQSEWDFSLAVITLCLRASFSWSSTASHPPWEPLELHTLHLKTPRASDFPRDFIEFIL